MHAGIEYTPRPNAQQQEFARAAIDAGADVIIGHHPHVLRGIERYRRGIIFYSLGNFTFAGKGTTADFSAIIRLHLDDNRRQAEIIPLDILYRRVGFQPRVLKGREGIRVIERLNRLSEPLGTRIETRDGRQVIDF